MAKLRYAPLASLLILVPGLAPAAGTTGTYCEVGTDRVVSTYCGADPGRGYVDAGRGCYRRETGRACSDIEEASPVFDPGQYGTLNGDVAAAGVDPRAHWDQDGKEEGRTASPGFDVKEYLAANPDVAAAVGPTNYRAALDHYARNGLHERRPTRTTQVNEPNWTATIYNAPTVPAQPSDDRIFVQIGNSGAAPTNHPLETGLDTSVITGLPNVKGMRLYGPDQTIIDGLTGFTGLQQYGGQFGIGIDSRTVKAAIDAFGRANRAGNPRVGYALQPITINRKLTLEGRPWDGAHTGLRMAMLLRMPYAGSRNGGIPYVNTYYFVRDTKSKTGFYLGAGIYDPRPEMTNQDIYIAKDDCGAGCSGTNIYTVPIQRGSAFLTVAERSGTVRRAPWPGATLFDFTITARNLRALIARAKQAQPGYAISDDPADYMVEAWNFNPELALPMGGDGTTLGDAWLGMSGRILATGLR